MAGAEKEFIKSKADIFKALGHPTRLWIVAKLEKQELCVCKFVNKTDFDFSTISTHLSVLQKAGIVNSEKRGRRVYYSIKMPCIFEFIHCVGQEVKRQLSEKFEILNS